MLTLQFYTRAGCTLCDSALVVVHRVQQHIPFELQLIDIDTDPELTERYGAVIPVVACGKIQLAVSFLDEKTLRKSLEKLSVQS